MIRMIKSASFKKLRIHFVLVFAIGGDVVVVVVLRPPDLDDGVPSTSRTAWSFKRVREKQLLCSACCVKSFFSGVD